MNEPSNILSIESFSQQPDFITGVSAIAISKKTAAIQNYSLDFMHPHVSEGVAFAFCLKGSVRLRVNVQEYFVSEHSVTVLLPNYVVQFLEESKDLSIKVLFFPIDFISEMKLVNSINDIFKVIDRNACLQLKRDDFWELLRLHTSIARLCEKNNTLYQTEAIKNLVYALVYELIRLYLEYNSSGEKGRMSRSYQLFESFLRLLYEHHRTERSVQFYADKLFLTPKHLSRVVKEVSGKTVSAWIDDMVVLSAKALLKSTDMQIGNIADELHFANASFFSNYFKKRVLLTPLEYRNG
ncbi:helix-turn-helix domain-containing protein [Epilithonimonas hungarica]|uniref:AraC-type DNA-binding protein n=1 Tax=Epilithonimonas hungarica TaxID=454006 RepID=A0A1G7SCM1_9FLAO|nr:helix-turn-helix domain-containing protein [Epilithonimonas hungarica]SDG20743.1 AraC-type DNA-binding protein [Epilithonimonas hungarica]